MPVCQLFPEPACWLYPLTWGAGSTAVPCSGGSPGSNPTPYHCKFPKWTWVLRLGVPALSTAGKAGAQAEGEPCCLLAGWMFRGPQRYACGTQTVIHFPCIIDKSYFHFLCGHHLPVLAPRYAPSAPQSHFFLLQRPSEQEPGALPLTSVSKDYAPSFAFWESSKDAPRRKSSELYHQSAKRLSGKPSCELTIFVHLVFPQLPLNVSVSALLTVILVQDGHISSMSWVDTTSSETDALFFLPLPQEQFQATAVVLRRMGLIAGLGQ